MFEDWYLEDLLDKNVKTMWPLTDKYLLQLIKKVFDRIGISEDLKDFISIHQILNVPNPSVTFCPLFLRNYIFP